MFPDINNIANLFYIYSTLSAPIVLMRGKKGIFKPINDKNPIINCIDFVYQFIGLSILLTIFTILFLILYIKILAT